MGKQSTKSKIRGLERLLKNKGNDLPAVVRTSKERELEALRDSLKDKKKEDQVRKQAKKYRGVRFFERRKATRKLGKARAALKKAGDEPSPHLKNTELEALKDLCYILHYPSEVPYVSLYVDNTKDPVAEKRRIDLRNELWSRHKEAAILQVAQQAQDFQKRQERLKQFGQPHKNNKTKVDHDDEHGLIDDEKEQSGEGGHAGSEDEAEKQPDVRNLSKRQRKEKAKQLTLLRTAQNTAARVRSGGLGRLNRVYQDRKTGSQTDSRKNDGSRGDHDDGYDGEDAMEGDIIEDRVGLDGDDFFKMK
eukprot:Clim_evm101s156 gene=Clim_evmTU101s156